MEKWELHEKPTLNTQSGFYMQSISSSESENMLACNAYGKDEKQVLERAKIIKCAPELYRELSRIFEHYDKGTDTYNRIKKLLKKATE